MGLKLLNWRITLDQHQELYKLQNNQLEEIQQEKISK